MTIKSMLLLLVFLILGNTVNAQTFSQEFQNNAILEARDYAIENISSGYLIGLTKVEIANDFRNSVKIISTNLNGIAQLAKVYQTADSNYSMSCSQILSLADNSYIISGIYSITNDAPYFPYLMHVNADGNVNWAEKISTGSSTPVTLQLLSDASILAVFNHASTANQKVFCKLDMQGNLSNFKALSSITSSISSIIPDENSFDIMFVSGELVNISNNLSSLNWQRNYFNEIGNIFNRAANGDYLIASAQVAFPGYMTVFRTDVNGNLIWARYVELWKGATQTQSTIFDIVGFNFIQEDSHGNIIVSANSEGGLNGSMNVVFDANGNYVKNGKIGTFQNETLLLENDHYLIGGFSQFSEFSSFNFILENRNLTASYSCDEIYNYSITDGSEMLLPVTMETLDDITFETENFNVFVADDSSMQTPYCDIQLVANDIEIVKKHLTVYPNPSHAEIVVKSDFEIDQIKLFNQLGQCIESTNLSTIDLNEFETGIYYLRIETSLGGVYFEKVLKTHP